MIFTESNVSKAPFAKRADGREMETFRKLSSLLRTLKLTLLCLKYSLLLSCNTIQLRTNFVSICLTLPTALRTEIQTKSLGSAYLELGNTRVMVEITGPREASRKDACKLRCQISRLSSAPVHKVDKEDELAETLISSIIDAVDLSLYPKSVLDISCAIINGDGSEFAALVTAISIALANAGIPMKDLVTCIEICRLKNGFLLDPTRLESQEMTGSFIIAMMVNRLQVTHLFMFGAWSKEELSDAMELATESCRILDSNIRQLIVNGAIVSKAT